MNIVTDMNIDKLENLGCGTLPYIRDPNVEPAKGDVLFIDADLVIHLRGKHIYNIQGELSISLPKAATAKTAIKPSGIEFILIRKIPSATLKDYILEL